MRRQVCIDNVYRKRQVYIDTMCRQVRIDIYVLTYRRGQAGIGKYKRVHTRINRYRQNCNKQAQDTDICNRKKKIMDKRFVDKSINKSTDKSIDKIINKGACRQKYK